MNEGSATHTQHGSTVFTGKQAIEYYAAVSLKHGLLLCYNTGIKPWRNFTLAWALSAASKRTLKVYPRSRKSALKAVSDLDTYISNLRETLTVIDERK